jgi:hypothetical protein
MSTRSNISYITHQSTQFTSDPKKEHRSHILIAWLIPQGNPQSRDHPEASKGKDMEIYVDADFSGNWDSTRSDHRDTTCSRHGHIIMYTGCPVTWKSQLQTKNCSLINWKWIYRYVLCTMRRHPNYGVAERNEAHWVSSSIDSPTCTFQGIWGKHIGSPVQSTTPQVHIKVFEDNSGALEIATTHKYWLRTKHLNVKLHHFLERSGTMLLTRKSPSTLSEPAINWLTIWLNQLWSVVMGWYFYRPRMHERECYIKILQYKR